MAELPLTIAEAAAWLRNGQISSVELTGAMLARCHAAQDSVAAFLTITDESALQAARQADAEFARGLDRGPLQGIPIAIKDIIATDEAPTTANSHVLDRAWGQQGDATVVRKLRQVGAVSLGKLGLSEFAIGWPDPTKGFPIAKNPWDLTRSPGGSSSGTGAAVAAGLILGGLGTDTGGSIRCPAAWCGISGIKPTFGRVSKSGCVPLGYSLDNIGPLTRSAYDAALMLQVMAGYDPADPCTVDMPVPNMTAGLDGSLAGLRIGIVYDPFFTAEELNPEIKEAVLAAISQLEAAGASTVEVTIPHAKEAQAVLMVTMMSEAYAYHEPDLQQHPELYGLYTRRTLRQGTFFSGPDYVQAQRLRSLIKAECAAALEKVDVLITPTMAVTAPVLEGFNINSLMRRINHTGIWNVTGLPALSVPCGFSGEGLPIGMQIIGKPLAEPLVFKVGDAYQRLSDWHLQVPKFEKETSLV
jgi:aspartyl-tRNA(Asn)/glutamyl-tRNA(Gln) amidotransferase subunit A